MRVDADAFDKGCRCNIKWSDGRTIASGRRSATDALSESDLDMYLVLFYRFVSELDLSSPGGMAQELHAFLDFVRGISRELSPENIRDFDFVGQRMPILVLKDLLNDEKIGLLSNVPKVAESVTEKVAKWDRDLLGHEEAVERLKDELEKHKTGFNFVALHKGFKDLAEQKYIELQGYRKDMKIFGWILIITLISEFSFLYINRFEMKDAALAFFGGASLISLSITILLVYFFRIALKNAESCKIQLSQLELRKTLCQFVQDYANYAKDIGQKSAETLVKFENIIFSNIVLSDEKIPSLFEGMDQVSNLMKVAQGK